MKKYGQSQLLVLALPKPQYKLTKHKYAHKSNGVLQRHFYEIYERNI